MVTRRGDVPLNHPMTGLDGEMNTGDEKAEGVRSRFKGKTLRQGGTVRRMVLREKIGRDE